MRKVASNFTDEFTKEQDVDVEIEWVDYKLEDHILGDREVLGYIDPLSVGNKADGYKFIPKNAVNGTKKEKMEILGYLKKPVILVYVSTQDLKKIVVISTNKEDLEREYIPNLFMLQNRMIYGYIQMYMNEKFLSIEEVIEKRVIDWTIITFEYESFEFCDIE